MGKLIYGMIQSLDGYTEDERGKFGWGAPDDVIVGGGKRFFPDGVRLDLALIDERRFGNGRVVLRYAVRG